MHTREQDSIKQFNSWAQDYDKKLHLPFLLSNKAIINHLNPKPDSSILDVGCGTGILLHQLSLRSDDLTLYGTDISPEMVTKAKAKLGKNASITNASANALPYADNSFEYVISATAFHHFSDANNAIREMYRVLKNDGTVLILDPYRDGPLRKIILSILNVIFKEKDAQFFTRREMYRMFRDAGFENITQKTYTYYKLITTGVKNT
jgi:ubiquinone/menaquinone biosynthesis C-methylase UbiE